MYPRHDSDEGTVSLWGEEEGRAGTHAFSRALQNAIQMGLSLWLGLGLGLGLGLQGVN